MAGVVPLPAQVGDDVRDGGGGRTRRGGAPGAEGATGESGPRWRVPVAEALEVPEAPLPVDPYVLGCWLGGEHTAKAKMSVANPDCTRLRLGSRRAGYSLKNPLGT